MTALPKCETILLRRDDWVLHLTFNRPEVRNALNAEVVAEIARVFDAIRGDRAIRCVVLRGAGGNFCAGGDIKGFATSQQLEVEIGGPDDPVAASNRAYGALLDKINEAPQAVVAAIEGGSIGGGMGFTCAADVAIATMGATFALTEATLGLSAAQVGPFVVQRVGLARARMLAVTGARFKGDEALGLGLIHHLVADAAALDAKLDEVLGQIKRCSAQAIADTKAIMTLSQRAPRDEVIAAAARSFAQLLRSEDGREGVAAFNEKRKARWAE